MVRKLATFLCYLEDNCMEEMECDELLESESLEGSCPEMENMAIIYIISCLLFYKNTNFLRIELLRF
ncbi:hypothetical protein OWV82_004997 [Melia azedarach]|uniref:Uncharacterized protein n=1 Tax=Melia azedarach TaxID=155640 RepID=A0ACC1YT87_MELAZ|nr:hypothetical protein OWV82_004997 [Melia azedarach]